MVEDRIGYRYAKSVFSLAEEKNVLDDVKVDMDSISATIKASPELKRLLDSPLVNSGKKHKILEQVFSGEFKAELTTLLVQMLVRKGREKFLPYVAEGFIKLHDEAKGVRRGILTTAQSLSIDQRREISQILKDQTGQVTILEERVDPEIIGGFVLKVGDTLFDGSVASSLRKVKQEFKKR